MKRKKLLHTHIVLGTPDKYRVYLGRVVVGTIEYSKRLGWRAKVGRLEAHVDSFESAREVFDRELGALASVFFEHNIRKVVCPDCCGDRSIYRKKIKTFFLKEIAGKLDRVVEDAHRIGRYADIMMNGE